MLNPGLKEEQRSYTVHNENCIIVLSRHSEYKSASMPCGKIVAKKRKKEVMNYTESFLP